MPINTYQKILANFIVTIIHIGIPAGFIYFAVKKFGLKWRVCFYGLLTGIAKYLYVLSMQNLNYTLFNKTISTIEPTSINILLISLASFPFDSIIPALILFYGFTLASSQITKWESAFCFGVGYMFFATFINKSLAWAHYPMTIMVAQDLNERIFYFSWYYFLDAIIQALKVTLVPGALAVFIWNAHGRKKAWSIFLLAIIPYAIGMLFFATDYIPFPFSPHVNSWLVYYTKVFFQIAISLLALLYILRVRKKADSGTDSL